MNFALLASLLWLFTTPDKHDADNFPRDSLINNASYIIQSEADGTVLFAWEGGEPGIRPGYVNTTKWRTDELTTWTIHRAYGNPYFILGSGNHTENEMAVIVEKSRDGKTSNISTRFWNITFASTSFGFDKWLIVDFGKGDIGNPIHNSTGIKCVENTKKSSRIQLADCDKENRRQRWRFCLCALPPLPKGLKESERAVERIYRTRDDE